MINIKAQQTLVKFNKTDAGTLRYLMRPEKYSNLTEAKVIAEASVRSGIQRGALKGAWDAIGEVIKAWVTEGHSVSIPGLGTLRFGMNAQAVEDVNEVAKSLIRTRKVVFTPSVDIKRELAETKISITCYDKDGNLVKRVTSADDAEIEDPENENENVNDNPNVNQTVEAPVISGVTPFADTTTVSMSGPDGAEIHYTTDGSQPTAESQLYSEPFTLNASANVKAIAIKDGTASEVSTKGFTKSSGDNDSGVEEG